jgi:hypothetical protein
MLKLFWENLKGVLAYLPLILSESDKPEDVSLHRYMAVFLGVNIVIMAYLLFFVYPQVLAQSATGVVFGSLATLLGTYVVANIGKRYIKMQEDATACKKEEGK